MRLSIDISRRQTCGLSAFDARVVLAAEEASGRVACDLSRGVSRPTVDALRRAATIDGDGHSEVSRFLKEVTERITRAKLVGALGVIALSAKLQKDDDDNNDDAENNTQRGRREDGNASPPPPPSSENNVDEATTTTTTKKRWLLTIFEK
mmetsp:Transcript_1811/g.6093  ORF Transcript_1811/g.6093 Transcript_1811/m.6093 type:complete len:150 (-) Transcript_1811:314-763(-)